MPRLSAFLPDGCPQQSPWGAVYSGTAHPGGAYSVSTATHGGIKVPAALNATIPDAFRRADGWYEEDCDWSIPVHFLPDVEPDQKARARQFVRFWHAGAWEATFGETVPASERRKVSPLIFSGHPSP